MQVGEGESRQFAAAAKAKAEVEGETGKKDNRAMAAVAMKAVMAVSRGMIVMTWMY